MTGSRGRPSPQPLPQRLGEGLYQPVLGEGLYQPIPGRTERALGYAERNQRRFVEELMEFVRFPSVSSQPERASSVRRCAAWLADHLRHIGLARVDLVPTRGHPLVYAVAQEDPRRPTVLVYGHYDVQPADPGEGWRSPPFAPSVRGDDLHGRGASDDKGQMFAHVKALEAYVRTGTSLPVNVKCLFEGEEETGSRSLPAFLARRGRELQADVAVVSDMPMLAPDRPAITYAMRGALSLELDVAGPERDLHSGLFGGAVHNPLQALCEVIARLHDATGRVAIPGFYDHVRPVGDAERAYMARSGPTDAELLANARGRKGWGEPGYSAYERTTIRPALAVTGISGGYQGAGAKAVLPARAKAKLDIRLVPDQDPGEIHELVRRYVAEITPPTVQTAVRTESGGCPVVIDRGHPAMQAAAVAYRRGFGRSPVFVRSGGTIPVVYMLQNGLGIPVVLMGFARPDDRIHGPDEKFHLPDFFRAIATSIAFMAELARSTP